MCYGGALALKFGLHGQMTDSAVNIVYQTINLTLAKSSDRGVEATRNYIHGASYSLILLILFD